MCAHWCFSIIGQDFVIDDNTEIRSFVDSAARIGADCIIHPGSYRRREPQDLKFKGEPTTGFRWRQNGDENV